MMDLRTTVLELENCLIYMKLADNTFELECACAIAHDLIERFRVDQRRRMAVENVQLELFRRQADN